MHLFIASVALLGLLAAARGHDRRFSFLAAFAAGAHSEGAPHERVSEARGDENEAAGSFGAGRMARNLD